MSDEARTTLAAFRRATASSPTTRAATWARLQTRIAAEHAPVEIADAPARIGVGSRTVAIGLAAAAAALLVVWAWPWSEAVVRDDTARSEAVDGAATSPAFETVTPDRAPTPAAARVEPASPEFPPPPASTSPVVPQPPAALESPTRASVGVVASPSSAESAPEAEADALAREVALVQSAREAVLRGDLELALARTETHAREFPRGKLAPERWALRIDLDCRLDRVAAARTHALAFANAHPESTTAAERRRDPCPRKP